MTQSYRVVLIWSALAVGLSGCGDEVLADLCPDDPDKTQSGTCGCGVPDVDSNANGVPDCLDAGIDLCPDDPDKTLPGTCGCGFTDTDQNLNGVPDCLDMGIDLCPADADKTVPGTCGCGMSDADADLNGVPDCLDAGVDLCPDDADKTQAGTCGCGVSDIDGNINGVPDCLDASIDLCPDDDDKTEAGACGCGVSDDDANLSGVPDCFDGGNDLCPSDPLKTVPGVCGCGISDDDANLNGVPDCLDAGIDLCPSDTMKTVPGTCGCGLSDDDANLNGVPDCLDAGIDLCPSDPLKSLPGMCGCGVPDDDANGDGIPDCFAIACLSGFDDCNGDARDGCETDLTAVTDCGGCGIACAPDQFCAGTCTTPAGCGAAGWCHGSCDAPRTAALSFSGSSEMQGWNAADVNGDGHDDVITIYQLGNRIDVYYGNGAGGFAAPVVIATGRNHGDFALGDFNEDGWNDVLLSQPDNSRYRFLRGTATGLVDGGVIAQGSTPRYIDTIDYNHDGHLDLLTYLGATTCLTVRLGNGSGSFAAASGCLAGVSPEVLTTQFLNVVVFDWDLDGYGDIAVTNGSNLNIHRTTGTGTVLLTSIPITSVAGIEPRVLDSVDLRDGNGRAVVILGGSPGSALEIVRPDGNGGYRIDCRGVGRPTGASPTGMQGLSGLAGDFDEDGVPDRIWRSSSSDTLFVDLP